MDVDGGARFVSSVHEEIPTEWKRSLIVYTSREVIQQNQESLQCLDDCVIFQALPEELDAVGEEVFEWESLASQLADNMIFWFPHDASDSELARWALAFGQAISSGKVIYGREKETVTQPSEEQGEFDLTESDKTLEKFGALDMQALREQVPILKSFEDCVNAFEEKTKNAELRKDGERYIPLHIWKHPALQNWYTNLKKTGNRLEKAKYAYDVRVGPGKKYLLYWTIYADIYVHDERRLIQDQVVLGRTDIKCVFPYFMPRGKDVSPLDCEVVLIKEFRSPATTDDGFIYELPGGSSFKPDAPKLQAAHELKEEAGIDVGDNMDRIVMHNPMQLASGTSVHQAHLFSINLTEAEIEECHRKAKDQVTLGVEEDTEKTYVKVMKLGDILRSNIIDWAVLGMMHSVLYEALEQRKSSGDHRVKGLSALKYQKQRSTTPRSKQMKWKIKGSCIIM
mmetsp:Transcript_28768/g.36075  ORF Transcript_28768/g.36075 Transcript_28768/m.36075 type:complete len:453 (+) Transcript_28768:141-1499(+)